MSGVRQKAYATVKTLLPISGTSAFYNDGAVTEMLVMNEPNFILLYVDNPHVSAEFYARLLGKQPIESSPTFAMFALQSGVMLGLWSRHTVEPAMNGAPGASELAFSVDDPQTVREVFKE